MFEKSGDPVSRSPFKKKDRIKKYKEIREILQKGIKKRCSYFYLYYRKSENKRLGIVIKRQKNAVSRNRVKRKIREIFRRTDKIKKYDIIVKIDRVIEEKNFKKMEEEINEYFPD